MLSLMCGYGYGVGAGGRGLDQGMEKRPKATVERSKRVANFCLDERTTRRKREGEVTVV